MLTLTIDTSVITTRNSTSLPYLIKAHEDGLIDVAVSSRFRMDKEHDPDPEQLQQDWSAAGRFTQIPSTFLIGATYEDDEVGIIPHPETQQQLFCLFEIDYKTKGGIHTKYDIDHIYSHLAHHRDIFLTFEKRVIKKRAILREVGVTVAHPDYFQTALSDVLERYPTEAPCFKDQLMASLDALHQSLMNEKLLKKLYALKVAQAALADGVFLEEDEKAIHFLAKKYRGAQGFSEGAATLIFKKNYHSMKRIYLSFYPSRELKASNIINGIMGIYRRHFDTDSDIT